MNQQLHRGLTDQVFLQQFTSCELPPAVFTHKAHLRLAWLYLQELDAEQARLAVSERIQAYVHHLGAENKYHHTLTLAAVEVVNHFKNRRPELGFYDLLDTFPRLLTHFRELLVTHYSTGLLFSERAKTVYVEPDLMEWS